jgi:hypothetical protein
MTFVEDLHVKTLSNKRISNLWGFICSNSDGIDVERARTEAGLSNDIRAIRQVIETLRYESKSQLLLYMWDFKNFQIRYIFGITGTFVAVDAARGTNNHLLMELSEDYLNYDVILKEYEQHKTIKNYTLEQLQKAFVDLVSNTVGHNINSFEESLLVFDPIDRDIAKYSIDVLATDFDIRFRYAALYLKKEEIKDYIFPKWKELKIWNDDLWIKGVIDGIYKVPFKNYKIVDYKFGKPKEKYFMDVVEIELAFYNKLVSLKSKYRIDEKIIDWKPIYIDYGERWNFYDKENRTLKVEFTPRVQKLLENASKNYWYAMDTMQYNFQPNYAYKGNRLLDFCDKLDERTKGFQCLYRNICFRSNSFKISNGDIASVMDRLARTIGGKKQ